MRKLRNPILWIATLLLLLVLASVALALDSPQQIIRHVEGSAGQKVAADPFILDGTLGEPVVGPFVAAGEYQVASGYWRGITPKLKIFLPIIVK
jgi:hypothetical protein